MIDPADLPDDKARAALARYQLVELEPGDDGLDEALGVLEREFAPRGELERRAVIERWLARGPAELEGRRHRYHLVSARQDGALAGVRDCHTVVDAAAGLAVVYLAHVLVLPAHRRQGLASLLRAAPVSLGRRALADAGAPQGEILLAAEMEPAVPSEHDTLVRLVAYGRAGFSAIAPEHLPYCQPDFRDPALIDAPRPLPLLAIVKRVGQEQRSTLPRPLAEAFVNHLYTVFGTHCRPEHLARPRRYALERLARSGLEELPLLPLPLHLDDQERFAPFWRERVLCHHLPELR